MEYFKNHKRKHDAEEVDSDSEIEISKAVSNSHMSQKSQKSQRKKKDTKSIEELKKSILKTQQKTISTTTRRQVF